MPVMVPSTAMPILANHVYVSPPNVDLLIEGGRIWVENADDEGTVFRFTLPSEHEMTSRA